MKPIDNDDMETEARVTMRAALAAVALATLAGCAPMHFTKPGFSEPQFDLDKQQCVYEVQMHTANNQPRVRGYYRSNGEAIGAGLAAGIAHGLQQRELAIQCLRARGYTATPQQ